VRVRPKGEGAVRGRYRPQHEHARRRLSQRHAVHPATRRHEAWQAMSGMSGSSPLDQRRNRLGSAAGWSRHRYRHIDAGSPSGDRHSTAAVQNARPLTSHVRAVGRVAYGRIADWRRSRLKFSAGSPSCAWTSPVGRSARRGLFHRLQPGSGQRKQEYIGALRASSDTGMVVHGHRSLTWRWPAAGVFSCGTSRPPRSSAFARDGKPREALPSFGPR